MKYVFRLFCLTQILVGCAVFKSEKEKLDEISIYSSLDSKNLDVTYFRNGDPIFHAKNYEDWRKCGSEKIPAYCFYEHKQENKNLGLLYNWYAVNDARGIAPIGYHIPTKNEWQKIIEDSDKNLIELTLPLGGLRMNYHKSVIESRKYKSYFFNKGISGHYWSSSEDDQNWSTAFDVIFQQDYLQLVSGAKDNALSIRCIKD